MRYKSVTTEKDGVKQSHSVLMTPEEEQAANEQDKRYRRKQVDQFLGNTSQQAMKKGANVTLGTVLIVIGVITLPLFGLGIIFIIIGILQLTKPGK